MPNLYYDDLLKHVEENQKILKYPNDGSDKILYIRFRKGKRLTRNAETLDFVGANGRFIQMDINDKGEVEGIEFY